MSVFTPVPDSFDYCGFLLNAEIRKCDASSVMFSLLKIALTIWGLSWSCMKFTIVFFFYFCKECHWYIDGDCFEFVDHLGKNGHFNNINSSNPWAQHMFLFICVFFNFFH